MLSARRAITFASLNKHWYIQNPDVSEWIGRRRQLEMLRKALLDPQPTIDFQTQKRFVVHGISGSGKTQLVCKFAQDYRHW